MHPGSINKLQPINMNSLVNLTHNMKHNMSHSIFSENQKSVKVGASWISQFGGWGWSQAGGSGWGANSSKTSTQLALGWFVCWLWIIVIVRQKIGVILGNIYFLLNGLRSGNKHFLYSSASFILTRLDKSYTPWGF